MQQWRVLSFIFKTTRIDFYRYKFLFFVLSNIYRFLNIFVNVWGGFYIWGRKNYRVKSSRKNESKTCNKWFGARPSFSRKLILKIIGAHVRLITLWPTLLSIDHNFYSRSRWRTSIFLFFNQLGSVNIDYASMSSRNQSHARPENVRTEFPRKQSLERKNFIPHFRFTFSRIIVRSRSKFPPLDVH